MRHYSAALTFLLLAFFVTCGLAQQVGFKSDDPASSTPWTLVWEEDFGGSADTQPSPRHWNFDLGNRAFGNHELQYYTDDRQNVRLDGRGFLEIRALKSHATTAQNCWNNRPCPYTSGRLTTMGKLSVRYGKIEARIKVPAGKGFLPAFWALGDTGQSWPANGEIDIMEVVGQQPRMVHGTVHGPGYVGVSELSGQKQFSQPLASGFHVFTLIKRPGELIWLVDGERYHGVTPADLPEGSTWMFDEPFYLILNLAVGGDWPGTPPTDTRFPTVLLVDYVRVWTPPSKLVGHVHPEGDKAATLPHALP